MNPVSHISLLSEHFADPSLPARVTFRNDIYHGNIMFFGGHEPGKPPKHPEEIVCTVVEEDPLYPQIAIVPSTREAALWLGGSCIPLPDIDKHESRVRFAAETAKQVLGLLDRYCPETKTKENHHD